MRGQEVPPRQPPFREDPSPLVRWERALARDVAAPIARPLARLWRTILAALPTLGDRIAAVFIVALVALLCVTLAADHAIMPRVK